MNGIDYVVRLLLDNSKFAKSLSDSKNSVEAFKTIGTSATSMLSKFAGAAGVAYGGMELFSTAVNSCGKAQNEWNDVLVTTKTSVDNFFTALRTGDWSVWENGILNAIKLGKQYAKTVREMKRSINLGDTRLSDDEKKMNTLERNILDSDTSVEDKEKYFKEVKKQWADTDKYIDKKSANIQKKFNNMLSARGIKTTDNVRNTIFKYLDDSGEGHEVYKQYKEQKQIVKTLKGYSEINERYENNYKKQLGILKDIEKTHKGIATAIGIEEKLNEEEFNTVIDYTDKMIGYEDRKETLKGQHEGIKELFDENGKWIGDKKTVTTTPKVAPKPTPKVPPKLSIDDVIQQFDVMNKKVKDGTITLNNNATESVNAWNKVKEAVVELKKEYSDYQLLLKKKNKTAKEKEELKNKEQNILSGSKGITENLMKAVMLKEQEIAPIAKIKFDKDKSLEELKFDRKQIVERLNTSQSPSDYVKIKAELEAKDAQIAEFKNGGDTLTAKPFEMVNESPIVDSGKMGKNAKLFSNLSRAIRGVGDAMAATGNQSKAMARSLAMVNAAASIAMMISIMVEKTKASATVWDWIAGATAGVATVVALAAQLRSINTSRFANGGIVAGNNTIGDMNYARVNSGEMILNNRQQRNLFNLLNGSGTFGGNSNTNVNFVIEGRDLVGVLNNYNNKMKRVR